MTQPKNITITAWVRLLRAHNLALSSVEAALKHADLPPLIWYDVLLELERAGKSGLRPFEIERELLLPQYATSRLINRIEKTGYLRRVACPVDGRGQRLWITTSGQKLRRDMWKVYGPAIQQAVGDKLTTTQAGQLASLLSKLIE